VINATSITLNTDAVESQIWLNKDRLKGKLRDIPFPASLNELKKKFPG
jgi:hypothetical protein